MAKNLELKFRWRFSRIWMFMFVLMAAKINDATCARSDQEMRERFYGNNIFNSTPPDGEGTIAKMIDHVLEKEFSENDQPEGSDASSFNNSVAGKQAELETVAKISHEKVKKNDTGESNVTKSFQIQDVFNMDSEDSDDMATLIDKKDNVFVMSNKKSKYPILQVDFRLISDLVLLIVSAAVGGIIFSCLGQPVIVGYLLAGSMIGPGGLNCISEMVQVETVAQFGVVFLLFALGLEFSMTKLRAVGTVAVFGGMLQIIVFMFLCGITAMICGGKLSEGVFVGSFLSMVKSGHFELLGTVMSAIHIDSQVPSSGILSMKLNPKLSKPNLKIPQKNGLKPKPLKICSKSSLQTIKPYIQSEWKLIVQGWSCSALSVYCLSKIIPKAGQLSAVLQLTNSDPIKFKIKCDAAILAAYFGVRLAANYLQQALLWEAALNSAYNIRAYVFNRVLNRDLGFFEGEVAGTAVSVGDISHRITSEASDVADTVFALLNTTVPSALQLSAMAVQMLLISPVLSTISALVIPCVALVITLLGARLQGISRKAHITFAALSTYLNELLPSILFVKATNMESTESIRFKSLAHADLVTQLNKRRMKALIPQIVLAVYFGALLLFVAGSLLLYRDSFNTSTAVSFVTSLLFLVDPIQGVGKAYNELKQGEPAIDRLFDLTRFNPQVIERSDAIYIDSIRGEVKFCDISFQYGDDLPLVLNGIDLHIKAGEIVALVGPSGGGKTTLAKLLLRLYDPLHGHIYIDGHDIQSFQLESLRSHVALVSQDIMLFSGTVAENISYRDLMREIDLEKVKLAAKIANADEFIRLLPRGYETNIGFRGSRLSGGQKQRLAIARAIYQNSSILVMDEATSALDSRSELLVRQAVERVMKNHTVLIIAHRLETVLMAERVLLLEAGKLQEVDHATLVNSSFDFQSSANLVI